MCPRRLETIKEINLDNHWTSDERRQQATIISWVMMERDRIMIFATDDNLTELVAVEDNNHETVAVTKFGGLHYRNLGWMQSCILESPPDWEPQNQ